MAEFWILKTKNWEIIIDIDWCEALILWYVFQPHRPALNIRYDTGWAEVFFKVDEIC